jgi:hypothetical protein
MDVVTRGGAWGLADHRPGGVRLHGAALLFAWSVVLGYAA